LATSRRTIATTLAGVAIATLMLAGCSSGGSGDDAGGSSGSGDSGAASSSQTTEEACAILEGSLKDVYSELQEGLSGLSQDSAAAANAVSSLAAAFEDTAADVTNKDVRATVDSTVSSLKELGTQLTAYSEDPSNFDQSAATDAAGAVQTSFTKLQATCP